MYPSSFGTHVPLLRHGDDEQGFNAAIWKSVFLILQKYATHKCIHYLAMVVHIFGLLNNV